MVKNVYEMGEDSYICCLSEHCQRQCLEMLIFLLIAATGVLAIPKLVPSVYPASEVVPRKIGAGCGDRLSYSPTACVSDKLLGCRLNKVLFHTCSPLFSRAASVAEEREV